MKSKYTNWCSHCKEVWLYTAIMRHTDKYTGEEQPVKPKYCTLCGTKLEEFPGWDKLKEYWR